MKGLELSEKFYLEYGKEMIDKEFSNVADRIAVGLVGQGSECFGFDDELSCDHDFEPGFCLWLTKEDYESFGFRLERMYSKLPKEYEGYKRQQLSPVGGNRHGVMLIDEFYNSFLGTPSTPKSLEQWLYIPSFSLATACNGKVFCDKLGEFSRIREELLLGYPEDVRLKKIAAHMIMMVQTGLYNYNRCISRNEKGATQLCAFEFVKHAISLVYLINNKYEPFYKWAYRGMRELGKLSELEIMLVDVMGQVNSSAEAKQKIEVIEKICELVAIELKNQKIIDAFENDFEKQAYLVQNKIKNPILRNAHIMDGI